MTRRSILVCLAAVMLAGTLPLLAEAKTSPQPEVVKWAVQHQLSPISQQRDNPAADGSYELYYPNYWSIDGSKWGRSRCLPFVQDAYGSHTSGDAQRAPLDEYAFLKKDIHDAGSGDPDPGALVFFDRTEKSPGGHIGISLGGRSMVSVLAYQDVPAIATSSIDDERVVGKYLGWVVPSNRSHWPGRGQSGSAPGDASSMSPSPGFSPGPGSVLRPPSGGGVFGGVQIGPTSFPTSGSPASGPGQPPPGSSGSTGTHRTAAITDLGDWSQGVLQPSGVNNSGVVIANRTDSNHNSHARVWASGAWTDIPPLGGGSATSNFNSATGLNNSGDVVGWSGLPPDSGGTVHFHGFLWHGGTLSDLGDSASATPATPDTRATAINDGGQIVGYGQGYTQSNGGASTSTRAIQWVNGHAATIGSFRADSQANGITAAGQILVYHLESDGGHVAVWSGGQATECVATHVVGWAMNNSDLVVGRIDASPVVWNAKSGNVQQIGPQSAGHYAEAMSVNTQGQVVGYWSESSEYAFIWSASGGFKDLNTVLPSNSGWVLQRAYGINDSDQVVGYGTFHGVSHAFLFQLAT